MQVLVIIIPGQLAMMEAAVPGIVIQEAYAVTPLFVVVLVNAALRVA